MGMVITGIDTAVGPHWFLFKLDHKLNCTLFSLTLLHGNRRLFLSSIFAYFSKIYEYNIETKINLVSF